MNLLSETYDNWGMNFFQYLWNFLFHEVSTSFLRVEKADVTNKSFISFSFFLQTVAE